ncbi:MAG: AtpZ/AtpI family protein [Planctomycetaceae bacterium]|jgi:F0F1-type ATP synthase assembly protein I|nr:AtpZ/AtpI family protein [Planctomycetaceae bacterium]
MQDNEKKSFPINFPPEENSQNKNISPQQNNNANDFRMSMMIGYMGAMNVTSAAIEMVAPIVIGIWLDNKFYTKPLCILIGLLLGMAIMLIHLIKFAQEKN